MVIEMIDVPMYPLRMVTPQWCERWFVIPWIIYYICVTYVISPCEIRVMFTNLATNQGHYVVGNNFFSWFKPICVFKSLVCMKEPWGLLCSSMIIDDGHMENPIEIQWTSSPPILLRRLESWRISWVQGSQKKTWDTASLIQ